MADLSKDAVKQVLKENGKDIDEDAVELLIKQVEDYIYEASDLASEAARLDNRHQISRKDMKDVLQFTSFFRRKTT